MAEPFLSEIRIFSFGFAPKGWALCNGQLLPINQNQPLFSLLGTTFGGDGRVNFGLPNLQAGTPIHVANATTAQADANSNGATPTRMAAQSNFSQLYAAAGSLVGMAQNALGNSG